MTALETYQKQNLRSVQLKELSILRAIRDVCENNGIDYWLDGGTILGAVRHGGFIPWDDDIDIAMRKDDIPRFVEAAKRDLPKDLFMQTMETDPSCRLPIIKVRDLNSFLVENGDDFTRPYQKGLYVDIFPLMPYPSVSKAFCKRVVRGYCRANGSAVLHRVVSVRSDGTYTMCGDHQYIREPGIRHDQIVGLVTTLNRKGKEIPVTALRYRLWVRFWIWMLPLRRHCLRLWSLLLRLFRRK